jgi:hypothetical protein
MGTTGPVGFPEARRLASTPCWRPHGSSTLSTARARRRAGPPGPAAASPTSSAPGSAELQSSVTSAAAPSIRVKRGTASSRST